MRIPITEAEAGERLDKLLVRKVENLGRASAKRLFAEGRVRVIESGSTRPRRADKGDVAVKDSVVEVELDATTGASAVPDPEAPLEVVLETPDVVVAEKPCGQATAPLAPGERGALANALLARYPEMGAFGFSPREPGICHRLDTGTSGLVVAARSKRAFDVLVGALKDGRLDKRYLVVCAAKDLPESGVIDIPLAPHPKDRRRVYPCVHPRDVARYAPRPASTSYTRLSEHGAYALVEASAPKASRHQIRAHFAALGHPLVGDTLYGGEPLETRPNGHALHAHQVVWKGDADLPAFTALSPLPPELRALVEA